MTDYILVPVEPTLEMMEAGAEGCGQDLDRDEARGRAFVAYKAMIAAAPDHIADARKMVSRQQIREVFLRNGFTIKPGCDDLRDYVYKAAFELLELAAPAVQGEPVAHTFYILHDATEGQKYIKKDIDDGCLAIFEREEDAQRAKRRHPGTEYKRVDYYTAPQPAPAVQGEPVAWYLPSEGGYDSQFRDHATVKSCTGNTWAGWQPLYTAPQPAEQQPAQDVAGLVEALELAHMALIGYLPSHRNDITDAAISHCEQALAAHRKQGGE